MKKFIKNYKSSLIIFLSLIIGLIIGLIFKEKAIYLAPFGKLFINLLCILIIPIIFTSISSSIGQINSSKIKKLFKSILIVVIIMSVTAALVGVIATFSYRFVNKNNSITLTQTNVENEKINFLDKTVNLISVDDFNKLLTKENLVAIILFSIIFGIAINLSKEKGKIILNNLISLNEIVMNMLKIVMKYAPIGIGAYFASLVGSLGISITADYLKVFLYYTIISIIFAFIYYSLIAALCNKDIKLFWKESLPVIATSLSTCSSAACIPINIKCCKNLSIKDEVANTTISIGTNFHKDGSIIDSVFKIMFLVYLFNKPVSILSIMLIALLATLLISAVPIGGGTISEMLIISLLGFPIESLAILTIIATITDAPATMLNALGNTSAAVFVDNLFKRDKKKKIGV